MPTKYIRKSLGAPTLKFGPCKWPAIITVDGKRDFAERVVATYWTSRALVTILHGYIDVVPEYVYQTSGLDPLAAPTKTETNIYFARRDIQIVRSLSPEEAKEQRDHFSKLLVFK